MMTLIPYRIMPIYDQQGLHFSFVFVFQSGGGGGREAGATE